MGIDGVGDYAKRHKGLTFKTWKEMSSDILLPQIIHPETKFDRFDRFDSFYEYVLLDIQRSGYKFSKNHLIDDNDCIVYEPGIAASSLTRVYDTNMVRLEGVIAYLSNSNPGNYSHWMRFVVPFLQAYDQYIGLNNIQHFYVGDIPVYPFIEETLSLFGIAPTKIVARPCSSAHMLAIIPSRLQPGKKYKYWDRGSYCIVRNTFLEKAQNQQIAQSDEMLKRIYVQRGNNVSYRSVLNEPDVIDGLSKSGFMPVSMDGMSILEQVRTFGQAEFIVAPHGSALMNLAFVNPGTKVVEVFPNGLEDASFFATAVYSQACYGYLRGKEVNQRVNHPRYEDILFDIFELSHLVEYLLKV